MGRVITAVLALSLLLSGCGSVGGAEPTRYTATFLTLFDTVTTILGSGESEEAFRAQAQKIHDELLVYHQLFDIYNEYEGIANLKTVNDQAGIAPVVVDPAILELLTDCRSYHDLTQGRVDVTMGSVLRLWHEARSDGVRDPMNATLPDPAELAAAAEHVGFGLVRIDREASTVFITDPQASLDVGAIAKGWAAQRVAEDAPEGFLISVGGNVCATGPKTTKGDPWVVGIQDPEDSSQNLHTIYVTGGSVVTSGDYQRTYTVDGKNYHHIIDPETRMPSGYWRSVTVVCEDSALADALSTALFLLPLEQGEELLEEAGAEALWVDPTGQEHMTEGFRKMLRT